MGAIKITYMIVFLFIVGSLKVFQMLDIVVLISIYLQKFEIMHKCLPVKVIAI